MSGPPLFRAVLMGAILACPPGARAAAHTGALLRVGDARVQVELPNGPRSVPDSVLLEWIDRCAKGVADYFGGLPVHKLRLEVRLTEGDEPHGTTVGTSTSSATIHFALPRGMSLTALRESWVLVHELVHLGFPSVPREDHWAEEGLATYVEPIIRFRMGELPREEIWRQLVDGLPQGLNEGRARGLSRAPTWAATYWGGCLFWLLADLELHRETSGRASLQTALRGLRRAGVSISQDSSLPNALDLADRATGKHVLKGLWGRLSSRPFDVDLDALWRQLGVEENGGRVQLRDGAPEAGLRQALEGVREPAARSDGGAPPPTRTP